MISLIWDGHSFFRSERQVFCPLFGVDVTISVYTDGVEVHPDQSEALANFLAIEPSRRVALSESLFADYRKVVDEIGEGPEIAGPEQVWSFVRWTNVIVPRQGAGSRFVFVQG